MRFAAVVVLAAACGGSTPSPVREPISNAEPTILVPAEDNCQIPKGSPNAHVMWSLCAHVDRMCACATVECLTSTAQAYRKEIADKVKRHGKPDELAEGYKDYVDIRMNKINECIQQVEAWAAKKAAGSGASP